MSDKAKLIQKITESMKSALLPINGSSALSISKIDDKLEKLNNRFQKLLRSAAEEGIDEAYTINFKQIVDETSKLKEEKAQIESALTQNAEIKTG